MYVCNSFAICAATKSHGRAISLGHVFRRIRQRTERAGGSNSFPGLCCFVFGCESVAMSCSVGGMHVTAGARGNVAGVIVVLAHMSSGEDKGASFFLLVLHLRRRPPHLGNARMRVKFSAASVAVRQQWQKVKCEQW